MQPAARMVLILAVLTAGCSGTRPDLGVNSGRLAPCPASPNCVHSQMGDESHRIAPIAYSGTRQAARDRLLQILATEKRVEIVKQREDYIHATFTSALFRFVDDVEFYLPKGEAAIHVRSASRVGHSDLGVNRKRIKRLRSRFGAQ